MAQIPKNSTLLTESEIVYTFTNATSESAGSCYCKECGKFLVGQEVFWLKNKTACADVSEPLRCSNDKRTFLHIKTVNGHRYRRCVCDECIKKKFPIYKGSLSSPTALYIQYAYGISDEDFRVVTNKVCARSLEGFIAKYGHEEGQKRWDQYCQKQSETNTFEYKRDKYGWTKEQFKEYNRSRAVTLENLIKRHGQEEGTKIWEAYCERQRYTVSLEYFIKTYGEKEGRMIFENFNASRGCVGTGVSPISQECFKKLYKHFKDHEVYFGSLNEEYSCKGYLLDFYDKTLNVVIEFNGDYWHMNPKKYKADEINKMSKKSAQEIWDHDKKRAAGITEILGCKYLTIWETDYMDDPDGYIEKLISEINHVL